ncbi:hypothetical protein FJV76_14340 [Mesorhizobium sp. WSM4303]|uniref:hypothetical protein n=1 Tax=Mesorhizobium sp. WSM4303 TaxID=2589887 RepID=UPI00115EB01C|nr:hypothetical protein [Mesorhizobium sp. WSM4303]TRD03811.1 hypothetical protein FJV76_14340 [Mesorhizobium sp. WSM4303]
MTWTPYHIEIILHYHCSVGPFERWRAPIFEETVNMLVDAGLLHPSPDDGLQPKEKHCYRTSPRGAALVEMWCDTPLPEQVFIDPRFTTKPHQGT